MVGKKIPHRACFCSLKPQELNTEKLLNAHYCDGPKSQGGQSLALFGAVSLWLLQVYIVFTELSVLLVLSVLIKIFPKLLQVISLTRQCYL